MKLKRRGMNFFPFIEINSYYLNRFKYFDRFQYLEVN